MTIATSAGSNGLQGIARLFGSSKGLVFLGVMTAGMVLVFTGKLSPEAVYERIVQLAMVFFPAVAAEDAARNFANRPVAIAPSPVTVNVPTIPPPPAPASSSSQGEPTL